MRTRSPNESVDVRYCAWVPGRHSPNSFAGTIAKRPAPPVPADTGDAARIQAGRALITAHRCNSCHGLDLAGRENIPHIVVVVAAIAVRIAVSAVGIWPIKTKTAKSASAKSAATRPCRAAGHRCAGPQTRCVRMRILSPRRRSRRSGKRGPRRAAEELHHPADGRLQERRAWYDRPGANAAKSDDRPL